MGNCLSKAEIENKEDKMVLKRGEDFKESEVYGTEEALARISMELLKPEEEKLLTVTDVLF